MPGSVEWVGLRVDAWCCDYVYDLKGHGRSPAFFWQINDLLNKFKNL
jgi:hypothetical protein